MAALLAAAVIALWPAAAAAIDITVDAPPSLAGVAERLQRVAEQPLAESLARAGLDLPPRVHVTLVPDDHPYARDTPPWIVGQAFGAADVIIFPGRVGSYPHDSLESVLRHEIVHLALTQAAGEDALPRWFHEGVAVSVERGWGIGNRFRLLMATASGPTIADLNRLFVSDVHLASEEAYLLAAVLVDDLRERHGAGVPGAIARRAGEGVSFRRAFEIETGTTPDGAAARAWAAYQRWTRWIAIATGPSAAWLAILALAWAALVARRRRKRRQRQKWDEEERDEW